MNNGITDGINIPYNTGKLRNNAPVSCCNENKSITNLPADTFSFSGGTPESSRKAADQPDQFPKVKVKIFEQNPSVAEPIEYTTSKIKSSEGISGERFYIEDNKKMPKAAADSDGNFIYEPADPRFDQVSAFVVANDTLDMFEIFAGHKVEWASGKQAIKICPHETNADNAGYNRSTGIGFGAFKSEALHKTVQTAQCADIISHEVGHAILDGYHRNYLSCWDTETHAFNESFGDTMSIMLAISDDHRIESIIKETGGDLSKENRMSNLAEEIGASFRLSNNNPDDDNLKYERTAINNFKYADINTLPELTRENYLTMENQLANDQYSFSRIFTGTFYDILKGMYEKNMQSSKAQPDEKNMCQSLKDARDTLGPIYAKSIELLPDSTVTFKQVAGAMLKADEMLNQGKNKETLESVFKNRELL